MPTTESIVARLGVNVHPETKGFGTGLKSYLRKKEKERDFQLHIKTDAKDVSAEDLRDMRDRSQKKIDNTKIRFRVPVKPNSDETMAELRDNVKKINAGVKENRNTRIRVPIAIDKVALAAELRDAVRFAKRMLSDADRTVQMKIDLDPAKTKEEWRRLKRDLSGDHVDLEADLDRRGRVRAQLALLTRNRFIDLVVRVQKRSLATAMATLEALSGAGMVRRIGLGIEDFLKDIDQVILRVGTIGTAIGSVLDTVIAASGSLVTIAGDIGKLGGFGLFAPTALASLTTFGLVGVVAFKNFGAAVNGSDKALAKLPVTARATALAMRGVWTSIRTPIQSAFWNTFGDSLINLTNHVIPEFRTGLTLAGGSIGTFASRVIDAFTQQGGSGLFTGMFQNLSRGITTASSGIYDLVAALITLGSTGSTYLPRLGGWIRDIGERFNNWVNAAKNGGRIDELIQNAFTSAKNLKTAVSGVYNGLKNISSIARNAGFGGLGELADGAQKFKDVTSSKQFTDALTLIMGGGKSGWEAIKSGIADLGVGLATVAPTINTILTDSGKIVGILLSGLGKAIESPIFQKGARDLFDGLRTGAEKLVAYLPKVSAGFGSLMTISGHAIDMFAPVIGKIFAELADTLIKLTPTLLTFVDTMSSIVDNGLGMLFATVSTIITPSLKILLGIFNSLPGPIQTVLSALLLFQKYGKSLRPTVDGASQSIKNARDDVERKGLFWSKNAWSSFTTQVRSIPGSIKTAWTSAQTTMSAPLTLPAPSETVGEKYGRQVAASVATYTKAGLSEQSRTLGPLVSSYILPDAGTMRTYFTSEVSKANLGRAVNRAFSEGRVEFIPQSTIQRAMNGIRNTFATMPGIVGGYATRTFNTLKATASTAFGVIRTGASSLFSFLGGGWGVALIAGMLFFSKIQEQSQKIADIKQIGEDTFNGIATAAANSAQALDGPAGLSAALENVTKLMGQNTGLSLFGNDNPFLIRPTKVAGGNLTFEQYLNQNGFSVEDVARVATGRGSQAARDFLQGMSKDLGNKDTPMPDILSGVENDMARTKQNIDDILADGTRAAGKLTDLWSDPQTRIGNLQAAMERASKQASSSSTGIISSFNSVLNEALGGLSSAQREASDTTDKTKLLAEGVTNAIGASSDQATVFQKAISSTVTTLGGDLSKISDNDFGREFAFQANLMGQSDDVVKTVLEGLGFSADQAANAIEFRFGNAVDAFGNKIQVLGKDIANSPLDGSKGEEVFGAVQKVSDALAAASGIPSNVFSRIFTAGGMNFSTLGPDLAKAGFGADQIKTALEALGLSGDVVATQLAEVDRVTQDLVNKGFANTPRIDAFNTALDAVREKAGRVSDSISDLMNALDRLQGGFKGSLKVKDTLQTSIEDAIQGIKDGLKKGGLQKAFKNGFTGPLDKSGREILNNLSTVSDNYASGLADAFDRATDAGQGPLEAMKSATTEMQPYSGMIDGIFKQLVDSGVIAANQVDELKVKLGLLPEQTQMLILASTKTAQGDIAAVLTAATGLAKGKYQVTVDSLTDEAVTKLKSVGAEVTKLDNGKYRVTLGANDKQARDTVRVLRDWLNKQTMWVQIKGSLDKNIRDAIGRGQQVAGALNGGIFEFFKNGGLTKALASVKHFASGSEKHVAQIAPAGAWRVWAEPETGGEAYIPLAASKRTRSLEILNAVAKRFGYALVQQTQMIRRYADGSSGVVTNNTTTGQTFNITQNYSGSESAVKGASRAARYAQLIG